MCDLFKLYEFPKFVTNLKNLREAVSKDYDRMAEDAEAYGHDVLLKEMLRKKDPIPPQPYPNLDTHAAKHLLRQDIQDGKCNKGMIPKNLRLSQPEYQDFPLDVFRDHIYQEREHKAKVKARIERKQLRAMMLKPRDTVLPPEEEKAVCGGAVVSEKYATDTANQQGLQEAYNYQDELKEMNLAIAQKERAAQKRKEKKIESNNSNNANTVTTTGQDGAHGKNNTKKKAALEPRKGTI